MQGCFNTLLSCLLTAGGVKMKKVLSILTVSLLVAPILACNSNGSTEMQSVKSALQREAPSIPDAELHKNVSAQYDLNFEILKTAESQLKNENACISTFSLQSAIAMAWAGSSADTENEIKKALHFDGSSHKALNKIQTLFLSHNMDAEKTEYEEHDAVIAGYSNDLYLQPGYTWNTSWLDELARNYDAGITEMNFISDPEGARQYINDVVYKDTHERIKDLLPDGSITEETVSVLTNATYLKVPWQNNFGIADSKVDFHLSDGSTIQPEYLVNHDHFKYYKGDHYQVVDIALYGKGFNVMFIAPDADKFADVQNSLKAPEMDKIFNGLAYQDLHFFVPSVKFETSLEMKPVFQELGMKKPFERQVADFSKMTTEKNDFYISNIYHKTFIAMDKNGVEGAAATAVVMASESAMPSEPLKVIIDHPYFFFIYESETKAPIFFARVMNPAK